MKYFSIIVLFLMCSCGSDDVLTYVEADETVPVVQVKPAADDVVSEIESDGVVEEDDYPDGWCESDFVVQSCMFDSAIVAVGVGCVKTLVVLNGDDAQEVCEK